MPRWDDRRMAGEPQWEIRYSLEGWHVVYVDENFEDVLSGQMFVTHSDAIAAIEAVMGNPVVPARASESVWVKRNHEWIQVVEVDQR